VGGFPIFFQFYWWFALLFLVRKIFLFAFSSLANTMSALHNITMTILTANTTTSIIIRNDTAQYLRVVLTLTICFAHSKHWCSSCFAMRVTNNVPYMNWEMIDIMHQTKLRLFGPLVQNNNRFY
jgi:hypothetical protein